jgi:DNA-binding transcriptional LysR family regulator
VELTAAGNLLYDEAQRALQQVERTARAVQHAIRGKETIGIALEPCSSFHGFEQIMRKLNHASPHLRFEVHQMPVSEHAHRLRSGQIDIAYGHRGEAAEGVEFALLSTERLMAGLPAKHRLLRRGALDVTQFADEPFVFWARCIAPSCHDYILETLKWAGVQVRIQHTAPDHGKLLDMVAAGLGWTVAPACARKARHSGVAFREIRGVRTQVDLGLSYLMTHRDPAAAA